MRLRQLQYFVAVAEAGSFRRAAEALFMAQPSLSAQISALEAEVGGALLIRNPRGVSLTDAGRVLLGEARATLSTADRALRHCRQAMNGERGEIEFGTLLSIASGLVPDALASWRRNRDGAGARLREYRSSPALEQAVAGRMCDFGIGARPVGRFAEVVAIGSEEFVVVLPHDDPLLARTVVDVAELADRSWVLFGPDHGLSDVVRTILGARGLQSVPAGAAFTSQTDVAVNLAIAGLGPTLVPRNVVPPPSTTYCRSLTEPFLRDLYAYSSGPLTVLARAFIDDFRISLERSTQR